ncbi:MAG: 23S rRNA (adenine(2503)-C(2))-methyltransferase RlmN [Terrimicrobiaceae bacterium]
MPDAPPHILGLSRPELAGFLAGAGAPAFRTAQILDWLYGKRVMDFSKMLNLPADLRGRLSATFQAGLPELVEVQGSDDTTRKFLFRLADGQLVETVFIPASPALYGDSSDRRTLCVSSQVGCAYGCKFCASGLDGWKRNLTTAEIVGQLLAVEAHTGERVSNIVFMGMGEPFANYQNLMRAIEILNSPWGTGIGARKITVSTSGLVTKIREFADQPLQTRLAISLHGATDDVRNRIMPINTRFPLAQLMDACSHYSLRKKQHLTFELILIAGVNDSPDQARALAKLAAPLRAKVNIIPYNTVQGLDWVRPDVAVQEAFLRILLDQGIPATLRREKGHDIAAACGQLRLRHADAASSTETRKNLFAQTPLTA